MIYQEKIAPPLAPITDDEELNVLVTAIESEGVWVNNFIGRLTGVLRDLKH